MFTTSCEDMLTVDTGDKSYENANDTLYSYLGIMKCMQDVAERQVILGELRGDLVSSTVYATDTLYAISNFDKPKDGSCSMLHISDYYNVINNCNFYIANADTAAIKSNVKYMMPEYAQVQAIRAWAYLQLVKNYGSVPFVTEPITNLGVIKDFDYNSNQATKDNLVDLLLAEGLEKYVDTKYPSYGAWENGSVSISAHLCYIPIRLVLGDLYLLRGSSETDYRTAARYYYDHLRRTSVMLPQYVTAYVSRLSADGYGYILMNGIGSYAQTYESSYEYGADVEVISLIPGSANKGFGTMLTRVADIFGYTPTSSQNSDAVVDSNTGDEIVSTSGAISVTPSEKRQYGPSVSYAGLNEAQTYVHYEVSGANAIRTDYDCGDARRVASVDSYTHMGESFELCSKAASAKTFYYSIPIYRKTLIWLRLAEAINRAGYPEFAFAILKDGLSANNLPKIQTRTVRKPVIDEATGEQLKDDEGKDVFEEVEEQYLEYNSQDALYYVKDVEKVEEFTNFLDFSDMVFDDNYGIHARGCGFGEWDTQNMVTNLTGKLDSTVYTYDTLLIKKQGLDLKVATKDEIINAIENVIVDELALETAFEGNRFTDLVRIAEHKNASGFGGTEWLASKIADRDMKVDKNDPSVVYGTRNDEIYNKLLDPANWYFEKPEWQY